MKGSRIVIVVLVVAVAAALVWHFVGSGGSDAKKAAGTNAVQAEKPAAERQPVAAGVTMAAPEPNQLQRGSDGRRSRRSRTGDANEPFGMSRDFSGMASGMGPWGQDAYSGDSTEPDQLELLNLQDVSMRDIIKKVSDWTGKVVIPTSDTVMGQKVTIVSPSRIKRSDALELIFAALRAKGVAVEQAGNVIFLKQTPESKIATVPAVSPDVPLASLTDKNQIVQKTFVLKNYSAGKIYSLVSPTISTYGYVGADENTGNVTIIETVENLMRIERMIARLDKPEPKGSEERIFQLTTGDASAIAQVVEKLVNTGMGLSEFMDDSNRPASRDGVTSVVLEQKSDQVALIPEVRNNWIIARAWPEDMNNIGLWIERLDKEMQVAPEYDILQVRYVDVTDLADKVTKTLQSMPGVTLKSSVLLQPLTKSRQIMLFGSAEKREMVRRLVTEIDQPSSSLYEERTFLLRNADPDSIKKNIDDLYGTSATSTTQNMPGGGRFGGFGSSQQAASSLDTVKVISYPSLGQITVIASPEQMSKIARQIEEWDVPVPVDKIRPRIIELVNSDPVKMSDLLSRLFSQEQAGSTTTSGGNRNVFAAFLSASTGADKQGIIGPLYGQLTFEAVPDTKKIIVISKIPAAYDVVEALIRDLDRQEIGEVPTVITLKYADPEDLAQRLNAMFNQSGTSATIPLSSRGLSEYTVDSTTGQATTAAASSTSSSTGTYTPWWTRAQQSTTEAPISNIIGKVRFIPDTRSKSVMVLAPREYVEDIRTMIQKLDQPAKQVMVRAVILEVNQSDLATLGAEYSTDPTAFGQIGVNGATALASLTSRSNPDATTAGAAPGTFNTVTTANISILLDLLVTKANAKILNQPTLWTRDNEEATFFKGKSVPFITSEQSSSDGTAILNEIKYQGVGTTLRVRPNITPEKAVDMTVNLMVSQLDPQQLNGNPVTSLLDTTTKTIVMDGQTIMMGGIVYQIDTETVNKVPLLGDIPLLGALFSHVNSQKANSELIVFITPYVIDTDIDAAGEAMQTQDKALKKMEDTKAELRRALGLDPNDAPLVKP